MSEPPTGPDLEATHIEYVTEDNGAKEIERLRKGLKDIRDYKGYTRAPHFRRRAAILLKGKADE